MNRILFAFALLLLLPSVNFADQAAPSQHKMVAPTEITWGEAPPQMPPGQKMAVLYGDPSKPAVYLLRAKMPAGYKIPPHWHPTDELVTVISGTASMGMGDKIDLKTAKPMPVGSLAVVPAKEHHYLVAKTELVVQVSGMGPFAITYVNPEDDPTKAASLKK